MTKLYIIEILGQLDNCLKPVCWVLNLKPENTKYLYVYVLCSHASITWSF